MECAVADLTCQTKKIQVAKEFMNIHHIDTIGDAAIWLDVLIEINKIIKEFAKYKLESE